ncbi:DNA-binding protein RAP1 [Wickerhamomyces ciferrii]|uniref:DNA-binding protein RAP1 n=1 Tax=Wickerhamomyces ciferrii (strain ATCC 14091 / BCRC 22168 / CBS 111 / JCM 3599 / NBRC 0793 / NRRL Y-1031 F-60-10) TaxID=1206466 RepID=K0KC61_WICCF|nr:DNA-binding protein RAP1 [Wickerhamomyces ciferrii]CCH42665.1 DNA-binding protein RAP1 [Wickerhamomyces ciferrii]
MSQEEFESVPQDENDNIDQALLNQNEPIQFFIPINEDDRDNLEKLIIDHGGEVINDPGAGYYISKHHDPLRDAVDPKFIYESTEQKSLLKVDNYKLYNHANAGNDDHVQQLVTYLHNDHNGQQQQQDPEQHQQQDQDHQVTGEDHQPTTVGDLIHEKEPTSSNALVGANNESVRVHNTSSNKNGFTKEEDEIILDEVRRNPNRRSTHVLFKEIAEKIGRHTGNSVRYRYRTYLVNQLDYVYQTDEKGNLILDDQGQPIIADKLPITLKTKFTADDDYLLCTLVRQNLQDKLGDEYEPNPKNVILPGKFLEALAENHTNHTKSAWRDRYRKFAIPYGIDNYIEYYDNEIQQGRVPDNIRNFTGKHLFKSSKKYKNGELDDNEVGERLSEHNDQQNRRRPTKKRKTNEIQTTQDSNNLFANGGQDDLNNYDPENGDFANSHTAAAVAAANRLNNPPNPEDFLTSDLVTAKFFEFQPLISAVEKIEEIVNRAYEINDAEQLITAFYEEAGIQKKFGAYIITCVCGDLILIPKYIEMLLKTGENPPRDIHGIWTSRDDAYLKSEIPERIEYIRRLHVNPYLKMSSSKDDTKLEGYNKVVKDIEDQYINDEFNHENTDFEILSTMRYDPLLTSSVDPNLFETTTDNSKLFFLFDEHLHRLNFTLKFFKLGYEISRDELLIKLNESIQPLDKSNSYRIRLTINKEGQVNISTHLTPQRYNLFDGFNSWENYTSNIWNVYIDSEPIQISPFTSFKTTKRDQYNMARNRTLNLESEEPQEVLLYNSANQITEGSITNVAFKTFDTNTGEEEWITPPLASGCLCGVVRHLLLTKGIINERQINLKNVRDGEEVLLFNGIQGVVKGRIIKR